MSQKKSSFLQPPTAASKHIKSSTTKWQAISAPLRGTHLHTTLLLHRPLHQLTYCRMPVERSRTPGTSLRYQATRKLNDFWLHMASKMILRQSLAITHDNVLSQCWCVSLLHTNFPRHLRCSRSMTAHSGLGHQRQEGSTTRYCGLRACAALCMTLVQRAQASSPSTGAATALAAALYVKNVACVFTATTRSIVSK